jgi:hypothetical protein
VRSTPTVLELPFPAGTPVVFSDTRDHLSGRVLVPLTVTPGVSLYVSGTMVALHSAIGLSGEVEGATDAFGTGRISFIVPDGYSLVGEDGAFSALLPVPEPGTYVLMIVGLALVGCAARRQIR